MKNISKLILVGSFMALGVMGVKAQTSAQPGQPAPSTVEGTTQQKDGQQPTPKTTGAMDKAVGNVATSPDDVKRQTEGRPTAAEEAKGATPTAPKPEMTQHSPGTVGAAPGTTPPMGEKKQ